MASRTVVPGNAPSVTPGSTRKPSRRTWRRRDYRERVEDDPPIDPFRGDPGDPAASLDDDEPTEPLSPSDREDVLGDLEELEVFQALLEPRAVRGLVVDCEDCEQPHYFSWHLLRGNLRHLLDEGRTRVHEPAFSPDPSEYVSWDYARGFSDAVLDSAEDREDAEDAEDADIDRSS